MLFSNACHQHFLYVISSIKHDIEQVRYVYTCIHFLYMNYNSLSVYWGTLCCEIWPQYEWCIVITKRHREEPECIHLSSLCMGDIMNFNNIKIVLALSMAYMCTYCLLLWREKGRNILQEHSMNHFFKNANLTL